MSLARAQIDRVWTALSAITGHEYVRPATREDAVDGLEPCGVLAPGTAQEVAEILHYCSSAGLALIVRGGGTKLEQGNRPAKVDFILSTERLSRVIEHAWDDMTATVEAGCTIADFQDTLRQHGQRLAADPRQPERATVGGVLATAESGTLRIRYGGIRDLVLGLEMALPDGSIIRPGGKVVKNVAGYDLTKLAIGSLGTLGVITRAVFRLYPVPFSSATYGATVGSVADAMKVVLAILDSHLVYTGLQIRAQRADQIAIEVRFEGIAESLEDQFRKLGQVAGPDRFRESPAEVWQARSELFADAANAVICKAMVLPAQMGSLCEAVFRQAEMLGVAAALVAQATGLAEVRLEGGSPGACTALVRALRGELSGIEGILTVERCPVAMKPELDLWGGAGETLLLMRQIKAKFDPANVLNPGRFVGGI
jgi:glycolate oxidase FAD binding subunit